jgi:hypothetical protein
MSFRHPLRASQRSLLRPCSRRTRHRLRSALFELAALCCFLLLSGEAHAQHVVQWSRVGTVTTLTSGQLCRTDGTYIICDSNNPTIAGASLGIGTAAPQNLFDVNGAASIGYNIAAPTNGLLIAGQTGIGTTAPNAAALLDVYSTSQGFLPPRMTNAQEIAIGTNVSSGGLLVYNTTLNELDVYDSATGQWEAVGANAADAAGSTGQVQFNLNANNDLGASANLFWDNTHNRLGIGTSTMANAFEVNGSASIGYVDTAAPTGGLIVSGNVGIGTMSPSYLLDVETTATNTPALKVKTGGGGSDVIIGTYPGGQYLGLGHSGTAVTITRSNAGSGGFIIGG